MASIPLDSLSPFGRLAVKLDGDFSELTHISGQLQRLEIDSDSGLKRAIKLLEQFARHGQNITEGVQEFSRSLQEARERSEAAAQIIAERAQLIQQRKQQHDQVREKLTQLEQKVKAANASLAGLKKHDKSEYSDEEKVQIRAQLERLGSHLVGFIEEAQTIKEEAGRSKFKEIQHDAQSLQEALQSSRRKLRGMDSPNSSR